MSRECRCGKANERQLKGNGLTGALEVSQKQRHLMINMTKNVVGRREKKCEEQNFAMEATTFDYIKSNHQYLIISCQKHVEFTQKGSTAKEMMLP